ncbi:TldD/PmbA family protein [Bartonella sp. DGB2]|uniref:TldD/PmbA family protein n=1 Tax=Bartonella sp. DGB2 TaxID=3388426 RepID=UPI00398FD187
MHVESDNKQKQLDQATHLVEAAMRAGASSAEAVSVRDHSSSVTVRLGKVEETKSSEGDHFSLRVFVGQRVATVSANAGEDLSSLATRAVAMAKVSPEDPYAGLAGSDLLVKDPEDLDLLDSFIPSMDKLREDALVMEAAALEVEGVTNAQGATASYGTQGLILANSAGFCGHYDTSYFLRHCGVVAGEGAEMERDYEYEAALHYDELERPPVVGRRAGERTVRRLGGRQARTGVVDAVFDPRVARSIAGHIASLLNGASVARGTSLLRTHMGKRIMRPEVRVSDNPLRRRGIGSRPFDGEGLAAALLYPIEDGVLSYWLLSLATARELGLKPNGRGIRSRAGIEPGSSNFAIEPGAISRDSLLQGVKNGFYVTEVFGQGVDFITGQYSRGASGFWIENGEITYPVSGVTLASDLLSMLARLIPANDLDRRYATAAPTLMIEGMTLAGE